MTVSRPLRSIVLAAALATAAATTATDPAPQPQADMDAAAATYFGTTLRQTLTDMKQAGVNIDPARFGSLLLKVLAGEDAGMTRADAEAAITAAMGGRSSAAPAVPPMDEEAENAWVRRQLSLPRAEELPGGVVLQRLTEGSGDRPGPQSRVMVMYTARLSSGAEFDKTEEPFLMPVDHVVPGLSAALQQMRMGGTYRVFIPPAMGYGPEAVMDIIPANSALDFTISLEEWNTK